jgi:hypothetical protein
MAQIFAGRPEGTWPLIQAAGVWPRALGKTLGLRDAFGHGVHFL